MSESTPRIKSVLLRVAADPGHGGPLSEYRIESGEGVYKVTLRISRPFPAPGEAPLPPTPTPPTRTPRLPSGNKHSEPPHVTEVLPKERRQVEEFLGRLAAEFNVYELTDLKPSYPFLHPTFYSFSFRDSAGASHSFEYRIECSSHLDERYERLVREFESFFESERVFGKLIAGRRRSD